MLLSCDCLCLIDVPTRVTETLKTLIDHVITNDKQRTVAARVLISDLSYHLWSICNNIKRKIINEKVIRDMTKTK